MMSDAAASAAPVSPAAPASADPSWPVLTRYDRDHLLRVALPLGGIGTGTVSLGGRGDLRDWEVVNRPAKGFTPGNAFFALYARPEGGNAEAVTRALEGPVDTVYYDGGFGSAAPNHGLPRFRSCAFEAAYPLGQVVLSDPDVPVSVRLQAFNPFIPGDADRSGIPVAVLRYVVTNESDATVEVSVCGSVPNFIGRDGTSGASKANRNVSRNGNGSGVKGVLLRPGDEMDPQAEQWGTMALVTVDTDAADVTHRLAWPSLNWGGGLLDFWDDFSADGRLDERDPASGGDSPVASLAVAKAIPAKGATTFTFLITWHFPNRMTWTPAAKEAEGSDAASSADCGCDDGSCGPSGNPNWIGNYYTTQYRDAWDAAAKTAKELPALERDTLAFVRAFVESDLPDVVKEAALYNSSTLRTQTCFRTPDGNFYGWEGCGDKAGCCLGSCTHVWNYENATAFLFGDLARTMRRVEFLHATKENGHMSFRVHLPLSRGTESGLAAADGQMGCILKLCREWQLSGDDDFLREVWPNAKKALEFCWVPGGWDADRDGVMEGCQHNTMDVEYYGPNPEMGIWYLGALRAGEEMARHVGDNEFADTCHDLWERGSKWLDANTFNGDYYEHLIWPPKDESAIAPGLRHENMGARDLSDPELQLGAGCLADQLVGQYMAHICGLGHLTDPANVRKALESLMRWNFQESLSGHFNNMRTYAFPDEAGMLVATYPKGRRPKRPFPYYSEVWTGLEYTAAAHMLFEGMTDDGLKVIAAARARYDGLRRNPFNEPECGHHYARAMASWAAVVAVSGFHYSGATQAIQFSCPTSHTSRRWFWSNGSAWGTCEMTRTGQGAQFRLDVLHGSLAVRRVDVPGLWPEEFAETRAVSPGNPLTATLAP